MIYEYLIVGWFAKVIKDIFFSLKVYYFVIVSDKMFMVIYTLSFSDAVCVHL